MIVIRKFRPQDFPWVIDIERKVFNEHDPYLYMQFYEMHPEGFIIAEINGMVVGYIVGFQVSEETGRVFSLAVLPEYRNKRIGSALLEEIINIFRKSGVSETILEVRSGNTGAKRFYKRHGFEQTGILRKYYNDGENAFLMKLKLSYR